VQTAKLRIKVTVEQSGMTLDQKRQAVVQCQQEVKKLTCDDWERRKVSAKAYCQRIYNAIANISA